MGDVSLSTGTGALVHTPVVTYYGKREAEADPALVYGGLPYAGVYGYPYAAHVPLTYAVKPLELKTEVTATNLPVPVAVGGYKAEAGNNGDLMGAVHEVPGLVPAPALMYGAYGYGLGYAGYHGLGYSGYYGYPAYG